MFLLVCLLIYLDKAMYDKNSTNNSDLKSLYSKPYPALPNFHT